MEGVRTGRVVLDWLLLGPFSTPPTFATKKTVGKVWSIRNAMSALFEKKKKELREMGRIWWCWDSLGVNTSSFIWRPGFKHGCRFVTLDK